MDNSNTSKNRQNEYLGVNKIGKNIRKSPMHKPNFVNNNGVGINSNLDRQQSQPQVYNISKNDFRSIVQQLTGSPSQHDPLPRPPINPPKNPSMRLQRIRPPPLMPINHPPMPPVFVAPSQGPPMAPNQARCFNNNNFAGPPPQFGQPSPRGVHSFAPGEATWAMPALSPISAYMHQLQSCLGEGGQRPGHQQMQPPMPGQVPVQQHMQSQANGYMPAQPLNLQYDPRHQAQPPTQPQVSGPYHAQHHMHLQGAEQFQYQHPIHPQGPGQVQAQSPSSGLLQNPNMPPLSSPGTSGTGLLPSPTSQFLLPSPGGYFNSLSPRPRSPYPLLSPGSQFPPPLSPNFAFSPFGQSGNFGPLSPGISFPLSPSGFFPILSPRWRDQ